MTGEEREAKIPSRNSGRTFHMKVGSEEEQTKTRQVVKIQIKTKKRRTIALKQLLKMKKNNWKKMGINNIWR